MEDEVVDIVRQIFQIAQDETYSSEEALDIIQVLSEDLLTRYGHSVDSEADEE
jgi:hypothetical protein